MYYLTITNNEINGAGQCPCSGENTFSIEVSKEVYDIYLNDRDRYAYKNKKIVDIYTTEEYIIKKVEEKKSAIRQVRDNYLVKYVDYYQTRPLLWAELDEEFKEKVIAYRNYLLDYTLQENWWEQNPLEFEEWENNILN